MSDPTQQLAQPLVQDGPGRRTCSAKVLAFSFVIMGLGCAVIWSQTGEAVQEPAIDMPTVGRMQPTKIFQSMTPTRGLWPQAARMQSPKYQPTRIIAAHAKFPGTDIEIDATGVSFPIKAVCEVGEAGKSCDGSTTNSGVCGTVTFVQSDAETLEVEYALTGLAPGKHGFHIHEKADFSNGCASAGPHYNPFKTTHGGPNMGVRHVGDLGNVEAGANGEAKGKMTDQLIKLFGEYTVVGRSMMIHADEDDLGEGPLEGWPEVPPPPAPGQHTKTTGNAGGRIACGVIEVK